MNCCYTLSEHLKSGKILCICLLKGRYWLSSHLYCESPHFLTPFSTKGVCAACSVVSNSATPWTVLCQAPLSMGFPRQAYWNRLPFPSPGDLPNPGTEPMSPALADGFFTTGATWKAIKDAINSFNVSQSVWENTGYHYYIKSELPHH